MKKIFFFLLTTTIISTGTIFALNIPKTAINNTETISDITLNTESEKTEEEKETEILKDTEITKNTLYKVTLEHVEPIKIGDDYGWMLTSEPGQLNNSLNALGLGASHQPSEYLEDETIMLFPMDSVDLLQICNKLNLDDNILLSNNSIITITYSDDDVVYLSAE